MFWIIQRPEISIVYGKGCSSIPKDGANRITLPLECIEPDWADLVDGIDDCEVIDRKGGREFVEKNLRLTAVRCSVLLPVLSLSLS